MIQLMFLLVGWHYVKQGFGVLTVLSARRGVRDRARASARSILVPLLRRLGLRLGEPGDRRPASSRRRASSTGRSRIRDGSSSRPVRARSRARVALVCGARRASGAAKGGRFPLAPLVGFLITVWSWTIYSSVDPLVRYVIPALHSVQYLYFVWLMKRNEARAERRPAALRAPGRRSARRPRALRARPRLVALPRRARRSSTPRSSRARARGAIARRARRDAVLRGASSSFVNIHHYFMDHVIWRRDNPDTRYLRIPKGI